MAYLVCFLLSYFFCRFAASHTYMGTRSVRTTKAAHYGVLLLPCIYWILFLGLQDNVGSDYVPYFTFFEQGSWTYFMRRHYEYGFAGLLYIIHAAQWHPQMGFVLISFLQVAFFALFLCKYQFEHLDIFLFVYFACSSAFFQQLNALRQYTAMYIFLFSLFFIYERRFMPFLCCILLGTSMHLSCILLLPCYFLDSLWRKHSPRLLYVALLVGVIICFAGIDRVIVKLVEHTPYAFYLKTDFFTEQNRKSALTIANKLIFLPFYMLLVKRFARHTWNKRDSYFIHAGTGAYAVKIASMSSFFLARFANYVDVLAFLPLYYYLVQLVADTKIQKYKRIAELFLFLTITLGVYAARVLVFPQHEYLYKSILAKYI